MSPAPKINPSTRMTRIVGLNLLFMLFPLLVVVIVGLGVVRLVDDNAYWVNHTYQVQLKLRQVRSQLLEAETRELNYFLSERPEALTGLEENRKMALQLLSELKQDTSDNPAQVQRVSEIERLSMIRLDSLSEGVRLYQAHKPDEAKAQLNGTGRQALADVQLRIDEAFNSEQALLEGRRSAANQSEAALAAVLLIGSFFMIVAGFRVYRLLVSRLAPLSAAVEASLRISTGDLSASIDQVVAEDEVGELVRALNTMQEGLRGLVWRTITTSESLDAATQQILSSIRQQAATTQEQSVAIQQTTTTMEEISQSASQVAERAREVANNANLTTNASTLGLDAVQKSVSSTRLIKDQSQAVARDILALSSKTQTVGDIVSTVNDLAERSNLLALNASILAATSGAEGRGFSVVAAEMKDLAQSSKDATVEVRSLLGDIQSGINRSVMQVEESVKRVESGSRNMEDSEMAIRRLTETIEGSLTTVQQITASTNQQQLAFEQVALALLNIRQATEQSEAGTKQLEMAAANLTQLSSQLQEAIGLYRLPQSQNSVRAKKRA